ncbi:MAG: hypothetical protein HYS38_09040 [Acidobacteria bacterium]|nr:hypothetical protein [Acidobacteriota bacterium]
MLTVILLPALVGYFGIRLILPTAILIFIIWIILAPPISTWLAATVRKSVIAAAIAGGLLGASFLGLCVIVIKEIHPPTKEVEFQTGEYITKEWGTSGKDTVLVLDTRELYRAADEYRLMLVVLPLDPTVDSKADNRIDKTGLFTINQEETRLQVTMSNATLVRLVPSGTLQFFGLIVPNTFDPTSIRSVQDAINRGAKVIADPSSTVYVNRRHSSPGITEK